MNKHIQRKLTKLIYQSTIAAITLALSFAFTKAGQAQYFASVNNQAYYTNYYSVQKYSSLIPELQKVISLDVSQKPINQVLEVIARKTSLGIAYNSKLSFLNEIVTIKVKRITVADALQHVLQNTGYEAAISKTRELVLRKRLIQKPEVIKPIVVQQISGKVLDANSGAPLVGANVFAIGSTVGTTTDANGNYSLEAPDNVDSLRFTYIGYEAQYVAINGRSEINVELAPTAASLNELVVTALGIEQTQRSLGYSVEKVSGEVIASAGDQNVVGALQGRIPGVMVTNTSSSPGGSATIIIRGYSSLSPGANNQPLFVVDGIPISNQTISSGPQNWSNRAIDLNPEDIKSISVLKGAAAAALYGVRAANGAIIITTKKGKANSIRINFSNSVGFERVNKYPNFQRVYGQGFSGQHQPSSFWPSWGARIDSVRKNIDPNWQYYPKWRDAMQTGVKVNNSVSISGGNDLATYYGSVSNLNHKGVLPFGNFNRFTTRFTGTIQPNDDLSIASSVNFVNSGGDRVNGDRFMESLQYWAPTKDVTNYTKPNGTMKGYYNDGGSGNNPIYVAKHSGFVDDVNRLIGYLKVDYDFADWLSASYRFGMDYYSEQRTNTVPGPSGVENENTISSTGYIGEYRINSRDLTSTFNLVIQQDFSEDFSAQLRLGHDVFGRKYNQVVASGSNFVVPGFYNLSNTTDISTSQYITERRLIGVYGDLKLNYKDILYLDVTGRNDWSSTLPMDNRSFFYPSVSLGFVFSDAVNLPDFITFGKLRASYAQVGKDAGPYSTGTFFTAPSQYPLNGQVGFSRSSTIGSPDLKPEITTSFELGTNMRFANGRIGLDLTWYKANSADQIITVPISNAAGATRLIVNAGEIENKGIELQLNLIPVQTTDLQWDLTFNYSRNRSNVVSIREGIENIFLGSSFGYGGGGTFMQLEVGKPYGNIYGSSYTRYYAPGEAPEDPFYVDKDAPLLIGADGFPIRNGNDLVLGNALPDWVGGIYNKVSYKNISLSFLINIQWGADVYSQYDNFFAAFGTTELTLNRNEFKVFEGVTANGQPNTKRVWLGQGVGPDGVDYGAGFYRNTYRGIAENTVEDASFVKLRNIKLSYSLPTSIIQKSPFRNITASVAATNIILYTPFEGYDPEARTYIAGGNALFSTGLQYPSVASVIFSLDFSF